ncbi:unnamed protein product [Hermetia illucens]|uniref:Uncharacterized protein n=1 Tax=Hermetia illucens TaxID=343691 RepID=A0A7R8YZ31_HERIL|nr:unnamed protein product [Hermetia illucens]
MDLLLLSPPKSQQTEQLRHVAAGTIADPYQLAKDLQLSDDSDSEESFSVGKPEQTVKGSFCLFKDMPLLGDSAGQPSEVVSNQKSWSKNCNGQTIVRKEEDNFRSHHLAGDLQLSDDSDFEDVSPNQVSDILLPLNPGTEWKAASTRGANEEDVQKQVGSCLPNLQQFTGNGSYSLVNDLELSEDSDSDSYFGAVQPEQVSSYQLANDLQLSDDSDSEESFSVGKTEQAVNDSFWLIKDMPLLGDSAGQPSEVVSNQKSWSKNCNGQTIVRKEEDNFRSHHLAGDLQLSDDSDFEDVSPNQVSDILPPLNPGTEWKAASTRGANEEDVPKQVGSSLSTFQYSNGIVTGNGSYSLIDGLELSEDSDSDNDFGAVQPEQGNASHNSRIENKPVLNIGDPLHALIKRMPEELVEVKAETATPKGCSIKEVQSSNRVEHENGGKTGGTKVNPSMPLKSSKRDPRRFVSVGIIWKEHSNINIISNELVKPAADSTVKLTPAFGDSKTDGRTIERNSLHRIHSEKQRTQGLPKHAVTLESTGHNSQKVRTAANSEIYNSRQTTKPMKVATILPSSCRPEQKSSAPSLDPLPENYTLPVARKVRTSTFTKKDIENQISRGKELLQKASDSNCENERNGKKILSSGLPTKKTTANMSVGPERNKQKISKEIDKPVVDSKKIKQQTDEHERRTPKGSEMEGLISNKRNSANQSTKHSTSERKGGLSNKDIIQISEAYQKKQAITNETVKSLDLINKPEANGDFAHQKLRHKMDVPKPHKRNDKDMLGSKSSTEKDEKSANRDPKTDRRTKKSPDTAHNKNEDRKDEAHHELLHKMDEPKPHKEMLGSRSSTDKDEKPANRDGKTGRRTKKNLDVVHNKNEGRKGEAHKMEKPKPNKRNAKEMLGSRSSIEKDKKSEGNFTQETEPPRKKHKITNESKKSTADSKMRISEDSTTDKHERNSSKGSHGENKDIRTEAPHSQCKEVPSSKIDDKSLKREETANAPGINQDFIQDPVVKNLSDIDKFKILRQEYIVLMGLLKKPANLVVELKNVLDQKKRSGTAKEVMALKETILVVGRELRSESFQSQKRKLKQLQDQLESLKRSIRNRNKTGTLHF